MQEKYIQPMTPKRDMHESFSKEPFITREHIRSFAQELAKEIQTVLPEAQSEAEKYTILLEFFQVEDFMYYYILIEPKLRAK